MLVVFQAVGSRKCRHHEEANRGQFSFDVTRDYRTPIERIYYSDSVECNGMSWVHSCTMGVYNKDLLAFDNILLRKNYHPFQECSSLGETQ